MKEEKLKSPELGKSPEFTHSVASLLVFGSNENPYRDIGSINKITKNSKCQNTQDDDYMIPDAPNSIFSIDLLPDFTDTDILFKSPSDDVPEFELPTNIPGLSNIANFDFDFEFNAIETNNNGKENIFNVENDDVKIENNKQNVVDDDINNNVQYMLKIIQSIIYYHKH